LPRTIEYPRGELTFQVFFGRGSHWRAIFDQAVVDLPVSFWRVFAADCGSFRRP
jgi:hypothetical protein